MYIVLACTGTYGFIVFTRFCSNSCSVKRGFGGKGGKGAGGGLPDALLEEQRAWGLFVQNMEGEAAERSDLLLRCWGKDACPRAIYFTMYRDEIAPCPMGHCKTARVNGGQPRPCSVAREARLELVPPHLRADTGGRATAQGSGSSSVRQAWGRPGAAALRAGGGGGGVSESQG